MLHHQYSFRFHATRMKMFAKNKWLYDQMRSKVWDKSTYPVPNINGCTYEVKE